MSWSHVGEVGVVNDGTRVKGKKKGPTHFFKSTRRLYTTHDEQKEEKSNVTGGAARRTTSVGRQHREGQLGGERHA